MRNRRVQANDNRIPVDEFLLIQDRTGSMGNVWRQVRSGVSELIRTQASMPGRRCRGSIMIFDAVPSKDSRNPWSPRTSTNRFIDIVRSKDLSTIDPDTVLDNYDPYGYTPLHDAVMHALKNLRERYIKTRISSRPDTVTVVIYTDGEENASKSYNNEAVRHYIKNLEHDFGWNFLFLGAGIDAFQAGRAYGIDDSSIKGTHHTERGTIGTVSAANTYVGALRSGQSADEASRNFDKKYQALVGLKPTQTSK